ncbi:MAG: hypothetical protein AAFX44_10260 [Pseudomonadota bacterium]
MSDDDNTRGRVHPEMLVGVSAVIIGVCALGVSLYETSLMRAEQRAAVIPILELGRSYNYSPTDPSRNRLSFIAQNVGIGPARVVDFRVTFDGEPYPTWEELIRVIAEIDGDIAHGVSTMIGRTIPPGRTVEMFRLADLEHLEPILDDFDRLEFEACYCSVFDECWTTKRTTFGVSEPVASCLRSDDSFTE